MSMLNENEFESTKSIFEKCSLLVDSELNYDELNEFLELYSEDEDIGIHVQTYHVIGDIMRSSDFSQSHMTLSRRFNMDEFRKKLACEPLILAPTSAFDQNEGKKKSYLRWSSWTGMLAASVAAIAIVGVFHLSQQNKVQDFESIPTAVASAEQDASYSSLQHQDVTPVGVAAIGAARQGNRDATPAYYMAAHQQFGYNTMLNRNYTQGQIVQTTAKK